MKQRSPNKLTYADRKKLRLMSPRVAAGHTGRPILFFTISNGAAHTRAAESIVSAIDRIQPDAPAEIVDVSDYMSPLARFTHVTAYLWVVKNMPAIWRRVDAYQKRQSHTSPEWFYRRQCHRLFDLVEEKKPKAMVATEVGCGEIASLIKRDRRLDIPLVAVDLDYDFDRAWVQPEIDLYCLAVDSLLEDFKNHGVADGSAKAWGVPVDRRFVEQDNKLAARQNVARWLNLSAHEPIVLLAGGGEGLGGLRKVAESLVQTSCRASIVVLAGTNNTLKRSLESLVKSSPNIRVLGWTDRVPELFHAADVLVTKLGTTFDEACACGLPVVALPPLPGAETVKYELVRESGLALAATSLRHAAQMVQHLLADKAAADQIKRKLADHFRKGASENIAAWLIEHAV